MREWAKWVSERTSERWKKTSERTSKWPSTLVFSRPQCCGPETSPTRGMRKWPQSTTKRMNGNRLGWTPTTVGIQRVTGGRGATLLVVRSAGKTAALPRARKSPQHDFECGSVSSRAMARRKWCNYDTKELCYLNTCNVLDDQSGGDFFKKLLKLFYSHICFVLWLTFMEQSAGEIFFFPTQYTPTYPTPFSLFA